MAPLTPRAIAAQILARVMDGESLSHALPKGLGQLDSAQDRAYCQELCYGTLRGYERYMIVLRQLVSRPLKPQDQDVLGLLLCGLHQLTDMSTPAYAAVSATVDACSLLGKSWARGLVNAVLRRYQREQADLIKLATRSDEGRHACPEWIIRRIRDDHPESADRVLASLQDRAPMTLRINRMRGSRDQYLQQLTAAGIAASAHPDSDQAIVLQEPRPVSELPGFAQGDCSVQDAGAQLAAHFLQAEPGMRVLDACAAPGGKAAHILELASGKLDLLALDHEAKRLERVQGTLSRLGLQARLQAVDAGDTEQWWDGRSFQRILVDAPCSGSGVINRHPDIKLLRRQSDIAALAREQLRLLTRLWPLVESEGRLLYATCSVFRQENDEVMHEFLAQHADAMRLPIDHQAIHGDGHVPPGQHGMDGFFYALIGKRA